LYAEAVRPDVPAVMLPDTVTETDLPLGGQSVFGVAVQVAVGGVCVTPLMLVIITPPVPFPSTGMELAVCTITGCDTPPVFVV
jgi:hypothetical protein